MTNLREAAQMALDALEHLQTDIEWQYKSPTRAMLRKVEKALRAALAQPETESVAHLWECLGRWSAMIAHDGEHADLSPPSWLCDAIKAATAPPQREWIGLTDEEKYLNEARSAKEIEYAKAIEAKLKEKNA